MIGHRMDLDPEELTTVSMLPVTSLPRTLLDLAAQLATDDLVVIGDWMISEHHRSFGKRRVARLPLKDLRNYSEGKVGARGLRKLRAAIELMRVGVDSPQETRVRLELHRAGLPEFTPNTPIMDATGSPALWVDLGCKTYRTCIEYDGAHHLDPGQQSRDYGRDARTRELGWHQVRLNSYDMAQGQSWVVGKVRHALVQGGYEP
ncbi:endonuclease domain-containing protein [Arthrobacter jiangjiafuii]